MAADPIRDKKQFLQLAKYWLKRGNDDRDEVYLNVA